jgi:hypothetical protein
MKALGFPAAGLRVVKQHRMSRSRRGWPLDVRSERLSRSGQRRRSPAQNQQAVEHVVLNQHQRDRARQKQNRTGKSQLSEQAVPYKSERSHGDRNHHACQHGQDVRSPRDRDRDGEDHGSQGKNQRRGSPKSPTGCL